MDRFVVRETRGGAEYPQGNQMIPFSTNAGGNNMAPETIYLSGPFAPEFTSGQQINQTINVPIMGHHQPTDTYIIILISYNSPETIYLSGPFAPEFTGGQRVNQTINVPANINVPNMGHNMNPQMAMMQSYGYNLQGAGHASGIDPRYLAGYADNSAQFIIGDSRRIEMQKPNQIMTLDKKKVQETQTFKPQDITQKNIPKMPLMKKTNELDLPSNDVPNQIVTRADKLKALHKSGPRTFSGPIEKILKWHKSLQDIGLLIFYEIVAKCVSIRQGDVCSKNLVVRDDSGPAMQVVYYEVDFMLPELKPPCTIRVIGRMLAGSSRLQAFSVRPASGDDVATLPRRAAVASHHVAKLCKELGLHMSA